MGFNSTFKGLINSYYDNRHMRGRYNIHVLFHGKTLTKESN